MTATSPSKSCGVVDVKKSEGVVKVQLCARGAGVVSRRPSGAERAAAPLRQRSCAEVAESDPGAMPAPESSSS